MDTLASLALATEPPNDELLLRKPYSRNESLITANMWKHIICQGLMQITVLGIILFQGNYILIQDHKCWVFLHQLVYHNGMNRLVNIIQYSLMYLFYYKYLMRLMQEN
jgi:magnesium-transporting ATPase (P-type)